MRLTGRFTIGCSAGLARSAAWFLLACALIYPRAAQPQAFTTTTVQGTVYNAAGTPISGTLQLSWPAFSTAAGQAVAAGRTTVAIGSDGFFSVNLAPNVGATPAGLYYTAVLNLADGTVSTEYWVVPAAAQATQAQVRAQVMPAAQAAQAVSKSYVDQSIAELTQSLLTSSGGDLSGPLYLNGDPSQPTQAADKRYVDETFAQALPISGGVLQGPVTGPQIGGVYQADAFVGGDFGAKLQACVNGLNATYGGTCDARNFSGNLGMAATLTLGTPNATVYLPCATIATAQQIVIPAGTRNVTLHGCASRGTNAGSGTQGGTVFLYSGGGAFLQVGDATYATDTLGFRVDNVAVNTTAATASTAVGMAAYRTQELSLQSLYFLGNSNQVGLLLDGTGNYTGGTLQDLEFTGFQTAINAVGHQVANAATTDWVNASTFVRMHIDCPTSGGNPMAGTTGINLQQGDGNTVTGGDVEGCATALHLGANAQNNTMVGLRNENSTSQVVADAGSSYNSWMTGGTMFTGKLTDNGTRNSFLDTFHRSFNGLNGDWYGSQQDATATNHYRLGIGSGNERGLLNEYQTDAGYRWTTGLSDATGGEQFYEVLDQLNNVNRLSIGQYNSGAGSSNNQTAINAAGTGAVVLNGSANAGTGGVVFGAGGTSGATVATVSNGGNAQFNGTLQVGGTAQSAGTMTVRNNADGEVDYYLWPGLTASQKGSFTYKDWNGASQWYLVKDASNNWAVNSAVGGLDSFKAYQSTNSGDTYINASNATGHIRLNYEAGSGAETDIYAGSGTSLTASFLGPTSIKLPGLAAASGHGCVQVDTSGYLSNAGVGCGAGSVTASGLQFFDGTVQTTSQQGALTGSANDATARATANAALPANGCTSSTGANVACSGNVTGGALKSGSTQLYKDGAAPINLAAMGADPTGATDSTAALYAAWLLASTGGGTPNIYCPNGTYSIANFRPYSGATALSHVRLYGDGHNAGCNFTANSSTVGAIFDFTNPWYSISSISCSGSTMTVVLSTATAFSTSSPGNKLVIHGTNSADDTTTSAAWTVTSVSTTLRANDTVTATNASCAAYAAPTNTSTSATEQATASIVSAVSYVELDNIQFTQVSGSPQNGSAKVAVKFDGSNQVNMRHVYFGPAPATTLINAATQIASIATDSTGKIVTVTFTGSNGLAPILTTSWPNNFFLLSQVGGAAESASPYYVQTENISGADLTSLTATLGPNSLALSANQTYTPASGNLIVYGVHVMCGGCEDFHMEVPQFHWPGRNLELVNSRTTNPYSTYYGADNMSYVQGGSINSDIGSVTSGNFKWESNDIEGTPCGEAAVSLGDATQTLLDGLVKDNYFELQYSSLAGCAVSPVWVGGNVTPTIVYNHMNTSSTANPSGVGPIIGFQGTGTNFGSTGVVMGNTSQGFTQVTNYPFSAGHNSSYGNTVFTGNFWGIAVTPGPGTTIAGSSYQDMASGGLFANQNGTYSVNRAFKGTAATYTGQSGNIQINLDLANHFYFNESSAVTITGFDVPCQYSASGGSGAGACQISTTGYNTTLTMSSGAGGGTGYTNANWCRVLGSGYGATCSASISGGALVLAVTSSGSSYGPTPGMTPFTLESANSNASVTNSVFNLACPAGGGTTALAANTPYLFGVDYAGAVREIGLTSCWAGNGGALAFAASSTALSGSAGNPVCVDGSGHLTASTSTCTASGAVFPHQVATWDYSYTSLSSGTNNTRYTVGSSAGEFEFCNYLHLATAGTNSTTEYTIVTYTTDGDAISVEVGNTIALNATPTSPTSTNGNTTGNTPCTTFMADAGSSIVERMIVNTGGTGSPVTNVHGVLTQKK